MGGRQMTDIHHIQKIHRSVITNIFDIPEIHRSEMRPIPQLGESPYSQISDDPD